MSAKSWTRRSIIAGGAVVVYSALRHLPTSWLSSDLETETAAVFRDRLIETVETLDISCNTAEAYLRDEALRNQRPSIEDLSDLLRERPGVDSRHLSGWPYTQLAVTRARLTAMLSDAIQEDFSREQIRVVDGWQLSLTECGWLQ